MSTTRNKLIDVARILFAKKGVENTTMNDIALAANKGRRTIYTYFKSKREIEKAVMLSESDRIEDRLRMVLDTSKAPEDKLMDYIFTRFEVVKELVVRNGNLRAGFFRDVRKVERVRRYITGSEVDILRAILEQGVRCQAFKIKNIDSTAKMMILCLQGLDVRYIRDEFSEVGLSKEEMVSGIRDFLLHGLQAE
ncbi:MAG: TetR/AcrR family transcriptional regulator [Muribaculaceae bacterium]|nr:TetR/AcrR family transcriptional regulator [Muribaculaceae bacterium]MCF0205377.1 TetR/AcrR family transcriptional regulator [Muribaculaceae bacterium]